MSEKPADGVRRSPELVRSPEFVQSPEFVRSPECGLALIRAVDKERRPLILSDVARETGLLKAGAAIEADLARIR